ncbi:NAD(+) diphosphatase [Planosporangium sp. 12N6]|uniref:NAD(+) diphosphatase n=1 Tax=Planosporangium spinosum TaxID=3402278 RepID=UPI003CEB7004
MRLVSGVNQSELSRANGVGQSGSVRAEALSLPPGSRPGPPLGAAIDRAAHRRTDPDWLARAWADALVVRVHAGRALIRDEPPGLVLTPAAEVDPAAERYFLGEGPDGRVYFAVPGPITPPTGTRAANVREVGHVLPEPDASLFVTTVALVNWHDRHRYSPRTGKPTTPAQAGWTRVTDDGEMLFPRTDPAVIVLVHDGVAGPDGRCLLGHNRAWTAPDWTRRYSCLAGFVEPGEPAEATVAREIAEEVGVAVRDVTYVASQAWPFPGSLMLGYLAVADPDQPIRVDADEIADARWFTRAEVARSLAGDETDFGLPMASSIAHYLVRVWLHA